MHLGDTFQIGETGTLWYQNCFAALRFGVVTFELVIPLLLCMYVRDFSYSIQNTKKRKHHYLSSSESAFHSAVAYLRGKQARRGNRLKSCTINLKGHSASIYSGMSKKARVLREYNCTAPENVSMQYRWKMTNRACFGISGCMINEWWTLCYQYRYPTDTLSATSIN